MCEKIVNMLSYMSGRHSIEGDGLKIKNIDPCIEINGSEHNTSKFELMQRQRDPQLVVRRGQHFKLGISLNRPFNPEDDKLCFTFVVNDEIKPTSGKGILVSVPLTDKNEIASMGWSVVLDSIIEDKIVVHVIASPDAIVAKWKMIIDTKTTEYSYSRDTTIYILFNPWCERDAVFMKDEEWRTEAVLADIGLIWRGTASMLRPCVWKFSQFEKDILDCSLYLIHAIGKLKGNARSDPIRTSRALAAALNANDDYGCLVGCWDTKFNDGTPPTQWLGSQEILQEYYNKRRPVKYGQCWVFAGILGTVCRAIGIPARVVTNFSSAHDTQNTLTIDYFLDENGAPVKELNTDSIWNFHVWNEVWMDRPDIGSKYGGWQVVDATPQERSESIFRCGPVSVLACKEGEVHLPYDCGFLFAEVNADRVYWQYSGSKQPLKLLGKETTCIGQYISTKAAGKFEREDITHTYKYEEGTKEERETTVDALKKSESIVAHYYLNENFNDISFDFHLWDDIKIGQPFDVRLQMKNRSTDKDYNVTVVLRVQVVTYTGKVGAVVKTNKFDITVKADGSSEVKQNVTYNDYNKHLIDQCSFVISCLATVADTKYEYFAQDDFRVRKPDIKIILQGQPTPEQEMTADLYLENPLPVPLKNGEFTIYAPGFKKHLKVKLKNPILPGQTASTQLRFTPSNCSRQNIVAKFQSNELDDVDGFIILDF